MKNKILNKIIKIDNRYYFIFSFLFAALFAYLSFSVSGMLRTGKYIMLRGDLMETHVPYIVMFCRNILEGRSLWYSFDISMGMNTSLSLAYYAVNPFNILFLIFNKLDYNITVAIIIVLKMAFASAFFQIFASRILKLVDFKSVIISICYAFCGFMASYGSYHIMWIDAFMLLPLLCYLLIRAVKTNNYIFVCICYAYLFLTQFYMGYMVGIYSFIFYICYLLYILKKENLKKIIYKFVCWIIAVLVAVMISSVIWLPALLYLVNNNPDDATKFIDLNMGFLEIINSLFWGQFSDSVGRHSYSYTGIPVLILIPFYFFNSNISKKERILAGFIVLFLSISYIYLPLYKIMHAMDAPDHFWFRFSFLLSFSLCAIASRELVYIKNISFKKLLMYIICLILFYSMEMRVQNLEHFGFKQDTIVNLLINILFIILWSTILYIYNTYSENKHYLVIVLSIFLIGIEVISNMNISLYGKTEEDIYYRWMNQCNKAIETIKKNENPNDNFYRIIVNGDMIHNSDSLFGYNGITDFGSSENYNLRMAMSNMGYGTTTRMMLGSGYNPIANMLLGVKYIVYCYDDEADTIGSSNLRESSYNTGIDMYDTSLGLGYLVNDDILDFSFGYRNAFENLNELLYVMTGIENNCYIKIPKENINYTYDNAILYQLKDNKEDNNYYISFDDTEGSIEVKVKNNNYDGVFVQFEVDESLAFENDLKYLGGQNTVSGFDSLLNVSSIINLYYREEDDEFVYYIIKKENSISDSSFKGINYYTYNYDDHEKCFNDLKDEQLCIDKWENGYVLGHIDVKSDRRVLFTSIPYDKGWTVKVNGALVDTIAVLDESFLAIVLPGSGDYQIEMKYSVPGLYVGIALSVIGSIVLGIYLNVLLILNKKKRLQ